MPLYEYECSRCGNKFEAVKPASSHLTEICPKCKAEAQVKISTFTHFWKPGQAPQ